MKKIILALIATLFAINFSYAQWSTLGSDIYYNSGNVGIGTGPTSRLTVSGGGATFGQYSTIVNTDGVLSIGDGTNNFTPTSSNWNITGSNLIFNGGGHSTIAFYNADSRVDFIRTGNRTIQLGYDGGWGPANVGFTNGIWDLNGNVGIGTTTPLSPLHVNGDIRIGAGSGGQLIFADGSTMSSASLGSAASLSNTTDAIVTSNSGAGSTGDIILKTASNERLRVLNSNGNVGIGTTTPAAKLDVSGAINTSGNLTLSTANSQLIGGGSSWINVPYGLYLSGGTTYFQTQAQFRSGIHNDTAPYLQMDGGTSGYTYFAGNIGIGTTSPSLPLTVNGTIFSVTPVSNTVGIGTSTANNANYNFIGYGGFWGFRTAMNNSYNLDVYNSGSPIAAMTALQNGNILIGQTSQTNSVYKLDVAGYVRANEVVVNTTGADFVFAPSYKLNSIPSLKKYIDKNHHLPEIPSAQQMQQDGLSVGENQTKLLQKVEELTLYVIQLKEENTALKQAQITISTKLHRHHIN